MNEQRYVIKNIKSFKLRDIFECGQCFRWNKQENSSYTGIVGKNVINVEIVNNDAIFTGMCSEDLSELCEKYFDIKTDYDSIKMELSKIDLSLKNSIQHGEGIRILKQDVWEALISFIISANNNIPRIKKIIENLSHNYGDKIIWNGKEYYSFPTPKQLSTATIQDLRNLGLGFRDVRVYETTQMVNDGIIDLNVLEKEEDINKLRENLLKFPGVGPKVADCIMLFSMKKYEVFPIDVWVKRVMIEMYFKNNKNISNKQILEFANNKFLNKAGLAQQYLFYWRRELEG